MRVQLPAVVVELRPLREREAHPHHDAAHHLTVGAHPVEDHAGVVRGGHLQDAHHAGLAIDLHVRSLRDQLRSREGLVPEAPDASAGVTGGRVGDVTRALAVDRSGGREVGDRDGSTG